MTDRGVVADLNADWERVVDLTHDRLPSWAAHPGLAHCRDLDDVLAAIRSAPDALLLALLEATRAGDDLAPRVVLQAMLPKMVLMALRDRSAGVTDYVARLWCVIVAYPVDRRPTRVAANLALDTLKQVTGERHREPAHISYEWLADGAQVDPTPASRSEAEHLLASADDLRLLDPDTGAILRAVYLDGLSSREAAARHGGSAEMVRYRCSRAVRRLAGHAAELAAA
ncbi:MAG: RNA polymerase sigma factor [Propionibacteriaceae bacterium]